MKTLAAHHLHYTNRTVDDFVAVYFNTNPRTSTPLGQPSGTVGKASNSLSIKASQTCATSRLGVRIGQPSLKTKRFPIRLNGNLSVILSSLCSRLRFELSVFTKSGFSNGFACL